MTGLVQVDRSAGRQAYYARLMAHASGQGNDDALARMCASWMVGEGALPGDWGLSPAVFEQLMEHHFPDCGQLHQPASARNAAQDRDDECTELLDLIVSHRAGRSPSELWVARIVATACLASDHLWQDLGLWCRDDLSELMRRNYPSLAEKNVHNMKWKKFLYKQLCIAESIVVCRSPSCEVCADYVACFGSED